MEWPLAIAIPQWTFLRSTITDTGFKKPVQGAGRPQATVGQTWNRAPNRLSQMDWSWLKNQVGVDE